jgi:hypothetical protein
MLPTVSLEGHLVAGRAGRVPTEPPAAAI